jgi:hypothetical protein
MHFGVGSRGRKPRVYTTVIKNAYPSFNPIHNLSCHHHHQNVMVVRVLSNCLPSQIPMIVTTHSVDFLIGNGLWLSGVTF